MVYGEINDRSYYNSYILMGTRRRGLNTIITEKEIHQKTIDAYGVNDMINKAIQEMQELIECLRDYKIYPNNENKVLEERVDVEKMLNKLDVIFDFDFDVVVKKL